MSLSSGVMTLSVVCDYGISWLHSLAFLIVDFMFLLQIQRLLCFDLAHFYHSQKSLGVYIRMIQCRSNEQVSNRRCTLEY